MTYLDHSSRSINGCQSFRTWMRHKTRTVVRYDRYFNGCQLSGHLANRNFRISFLWIYCCSSGFLYIHFVRLEKQPQNHDKEILHKNWKTSLYLLPHLACLSSYLISVSLQHAGKHGEVCSIPHSHDVDSIWVLCR